MAIPRMFGLVILSLQLLACAPGAVDAGYKPRVRKELRKLSSDELNMYKQGIQVMQKVSTADGQAIFGGYYKAYDYFVVKHATATYDPRGDQGHFTAGLGVFHRAFLLEFEAALLSVVPKLKSIPYWDITLDGPNGKYWATKKSITSWKHMGNIDGDARINWQVTTGADAFRTIGTYDLEEYAKYAYIFNGTTGKHLLRSVAESDNTNAMLTRYPSAVLMSIPTFAIMKEYLILDENSAALGYNMTKAEFDYCTNPDIIKNITEWTWCVDFGSIPGMLTGQSTVPVIKSGLIHPGLHFSLGSFSPLSPNPASPLSGDCLDVATSPNEAFMFWIHHTNLDRNLMMWQINAQKMDPKMADDSVMWKYPKSILEYSLGYPGIYLDDVISSNFPITTLGGGLNNATGYTHFQLLNLTRPGINCPYTYDNMKSS